jgi:proline iminopeptidase
VISGYQAARPRWVERFTNYWLYIPVVWPMQARMLAVLKRNIEQSAKAAQQTASAETTA